jgi:hypothetical protein
VSRFVLAGLALHARSQLATRRRPGEVWRFQETVPAMLAGITALLDDRIGRAMVVAANLLREAVDSGAVEAGSGL